MPKVVDHDQRRREIIDVVWRLLATRGMAALSMRAIAEEAGYANGVLAYYFADKDALLRAAHELVFAATNERIVRASGDARGLSALRAVCGEIMPVTEESLLEARIATALWQRAMYDEDTRAASTAAWDEWRRLIERHLKDAVTDGEIDSIDLPVAADNVLTVLMGFQVTASLAPESMTPEHQWSVLEHSLRQTRTGRSCRKER
ncbi:TetR/AcrR family transcriptional regulator [Rhodococcus sp. NBC_00297]|uniref:TetR/AcrR family transcriptional regulator n=1 Tax=Rhodococcus sp. NBC_00297 TaxID=2976005 RepID=UPI002E2DAB20|nr:TetR/AcrR family transcriptional regulator [Rhodococcus sp. NBC_00297]